MKKDNQKNTIVLSKHFDHWCLSSKTIKLQPSDMFNVSWLNYEDRWEYRTDNESDILDHALAIAEKFNYCLEIE